MENTNLNDVVQIGEKSRTAVQETGSERMITVVTFGRFDVFVNGKVVVFKSKKAKELIALCIDRMGGIVKMDEAVGDLWDSAPYDERAKRRYRKAALSAYKTLVEAGAAGMFGRQRGGCFINRNTLRCDLYDFLDGDEKARALFRGEYMFDYPWGERTLGWIESLNTQKHIDY